MVCHIVLFRLRPELAPEDRQALTRSLRAALEQIESIRRVHVGRRVTHGREYERRMTDDLEYAAVLEFEDLAGLLAYLRHPAHEELGARFNASVASAVIYDYEMEGRESLAKLLGDG